MNNLEYRRCDLCYGLKIIKGGGFMDVTCHRCNGTGRLIVDEQIDHKCEGKTHVEYKKRRGRPVRTLDEEDL